MILCKDRHSSAICADKITILTKGTDTSADSQHHWIQIDGDTVLRYGIERTSDWEKDYLLLSANRTKSKESKMDYLKEYFSKNRDTIFTIVLVVLIDHFVFNGAFREKVKSVVDSMLNKANKQIEAS